MLFSNLKDKKCVNLDPLPRDLNSFIACLHDHNFSVMDCPVNKTFNKLLHKCEIKISVCDSNPCQSGGLCSENSTNDYACECKTGFTGKNCELEVDACFLNPCGTENTCNIMADGSPIPYYCECFDLEQIGLNCNSTSEVNPCLNNEKEKLYSTEISKSVYVQCTGRRPMIMPCPKPLVFSFTEQRCDW